MDLIILYFNDGATRVDILNGENRMDAVGTASNGHENVDNPSYLSKNDSGNLAQ